MRASRRSSVIAGASVELSASPLASGSLPCSPLLPEECACCGAATTHRVALGRHESSGPIVGYCDECAEHQASSSSRVLALALASLLLAIVAAAGLPLLAPTLGLFGLALAVGAVAASPLLVLLLPEPAVPPGHAARGLAVRWERAGHLWCAAPRYAARVAELNGGQLRPHAVRERRGSAWLSAGPVLGLCAACASFFVYHPLLRILNLGSVRARVALDGRPLAVVDATSNESPAAGALLRVPAGRHTLSVNSSADGTPLARVTADFQSGAVHLFAIAGEDSCFWLETSGYGRERRAAPSYQPLPGNQQFWVLPGGIDTWFAPNPGESDPNSRSSGGLLTALRQASCAVAPPAVRSGR